MSFVKKLLRKLEPEKHNFQLDYNSQIQLLPFSIDDLLKNIEQHDQQITRESNQLCIVCLLK